MSTDIDIKNYSGEILDSAAVSQTNDTNSYLDEVQNEGLPALEIPQDQTVEADKMVEKEPSAQELNFKALREEVDRLKAERESEKREHQLNIDMMRANMAKSQEPPKERKMFPDGVDRSDVLTVGEMEKAWESREAEYLSRIEELQVAQQYPDYAEVIEKFALPLVKSKPHLAEGIQGARNKALMAYELGKMAKQMQQTPPPVQQSSIAQKIVENAKKPGTLSQSGGQSVLSKADYYATMSDQEFMKMASHNLEGI